MPLAPDQPPVTFIPQLKPGDTLGDRFTIVEFLGRGGMGEVYEAADQHLQGKCLALKTVREEIASEPRMRLRFEREVLLAREVQHPNVCPTYDLFRVAGPRGPLSFLTMKLLRGESLAALLNRRGRLPPVEVLAIASQMAAGLDAAHRAGIVHRDFKPGNVFVEGEWPHTHVSITDFGLSRQQDSESTVTEGLFGTPGYIAPERYQGYAATQASDVYALGVVLYEMLTGRRPEGLPGGAAYVGPSNVVEGLPRSWDRAILACLEPDQAKRFRGAGEALAALDSRTSTSTAAALSRMSRRGIVQAVAGAAVVLTGVAWFGWPKIYRILKPLPERRFVALMAWPLEPDSPSGPLLRGILDGIGNRLARAEAASNNFLVISAADVAGQAPPKALSDVVASLGANLVLGASLHSSGSEYRLTLRILDPGNGRVLRQRTLAGPRAEQNRLSDKCAAAAELLDVRLPQTKLKDQDELANVPPAAYQLYGTAEDLIAQPNDVGVDAAIETYQKALDADPRFSLAYARLSMAYARKYRKTRDRAGLNLAAKNADMAIRYNPDSAKAVLSRAMVDLHLGNSEAAAAGMSAALQLDPGNPQILLYTAWLYRDVGRFGDEERLYREIIKDRPNFWPAYNDLGFVLYRQSKYEEAAAIFGEAAAVAQRVALPLTNQATMLALLKRTKEAEEAFRKSLERGPSRAAYQNLGSIAFQRADYKTALDYYSKARDMQPKNDLTWRNIADCYAMLGQPNRVAEHYAKAAEILRESLRLNPRRGATWITLAFYEAKLGRSAQAEEALKNAEARGAADVHSQFTKAQALALLGRKEDALRLVLGCMDKGLLAVEVELAIDLKELRADPRYQRRAASTRQ